MATLLAELAPGAEQGVVDRLSALGITLIKAYENISAFMGTIIRLFDAPPGTLIPPLMQLAGIRYLEPDEEHIYVQRVPQLPFGTPFLSLGPAADADASALPEITRLIGAQRAQERSRGGEGVIILVVDSGVDGSRVPASKRAGAWTDDLEQPDPWVDRTGHGTMVALIALAVAPNAQIFSVKPKAGPNGGIMKESVMAAIDALIPIVQENPDIKLVMNNSWGTAGCAANPYW